MFQKKKDNNINNNKNNISSNISNSFTNEIINDINNNITNIITNDLSNNFTNIISDSLKCESGYFLTNNNKSCKKCPIDNCEKCYERNNVNLCIFCMRDFIPIYENGIINLCQNGCDIGKEEKCLSCDSDNIKCLSCNIGYKLVNGKCILNYSFKAVYQIKNENERIRLIYHEYLDYILK